MDRRARLQRRTRNTWRQTEPGIEAGGPHQPKCPKRRGQRFCFTSAVGRDVNGSSWRIPKPRSPQRPGRATLTAPTQERVMRSVQEGTRVPWNRGQIIGPKPPLKPRHIWAIRTRLQLARRVRELAIFNLAIDSKLRGCDLVKLKVSDVKLGDGIRARSTVIQQKTGGPRAVRDHGPARRGTRRLDRLTRVDVSQLAVPQPKPKRRAPHHAPVWTSGR
jgi:integrase